MFISLHMSTSILFYTGMLSVGSGEFQLGLFLLLGCDLIMLYCLFDLIKRLQKLEDMKKKRINKEKKEQMTILVLKQVETQEEERTRIGRDLHDTLSNQLSLILLRLNTDYAPIQLEQDIRAVLLTVRDISHDLNPPFQDDSPLYLLIIYQFEKLRPAYVIHKKIVVYSNKNESVQYKMMIIRVIQELITNIIKHARATKIQLAIRVSYRGLYISIEDNGVGHTKTEQGQGYHNIKNRLSLLNGQYKIKSKRDCGTKIIVLIKHET